jgi:hypothetical protein
MSCIAMHAHTYPLPYLCTKNAHPSLVGLVAYAGQRPQAGRQVTPVGILQAAAQQQQQCGGSVRHKSRTFCCGWSELLLELSSSLHDYAHCCDISLFNHDMSCLQANCSSLQHQYTLSLQAKSDAPPACHSTAASSTAA